MAVKVPETAWQSGRFDARTTGPSRLLFGQMYEDAAIELSAFPPGGRIFCIASAGCTAMKLACHHEVVAVDLNPMQVAYVRRRLTGAPIERGNADQFLRFGRAFAPLAGWTRGKVSAFLELDDPDEQIRYWRRHLDTRRFRAAFNFLFSRAILGLVYSATFLGCLPPKAGAVMRSRMERCFALHPNKNNPWAKALFLGESILAPTLEEIGQIELHCDEAAAFLETQTAGTFIGFSLSNILDGTSVAYRKRLLNAVQHAAAPGAMVVLRSFSQPQSWLATNRAAEDRAMLWGIVDVRPAVAF